MLETNSVALLISMCASILAIGIHIVAVNNGYNESNNIFPNIITDFKKIILSGVQFYAAMILLYFAMLIFGFIIAALIIPLALLKSNIPEALLITIMIILILGMIFIFLLGIILVCGLIFNFTKSLNFEDIINVKKAYILMVSSKKEFCIYFLKSIAFNLTLLIAVAALFIAATVLFGITGGIKGMINELSEVQFIAIFGVIWIIYCVFISLFQIDLERQYLIETKKYEN